MGEIIAVEVVDQLEQFRLIFGQRADEMSDPVNEEDDVFVVSEGAHGSTCHFSVYLVVWFWC